MVVHDTNHAEKLTFDLVEQRYDDIERRQWQLRQTAGRECALEGEPRAMADGAALLHLDELAEVGQRGLDLGVDLAQGGALDGAL